MNYRVAIAALLICISSIQPASTQSPKGASGANDYVPRLGDIMATVQSRHIKLWFAGKFLNWELAAFEVAQLKAGLVHAAMLYPGIPVTDVTTMTKPLDSIAAAAE